MFHLLAVTFCFFKLFNKLILTQYIHLEIVTDEIKKKKSKITDASCTFKHGCPANSELNLLALEMVAEWKMLGRQLGVPTSKINELQRDNVNFCGIVDKARGMLDAWYDKGECPTYAVLGAALNSLGKCRLAVKYCCNI